MMDVRIPKMGMSTVEVDISEVYVKDGQLVAIGDPLVRLEAEKASFDLEAEGSGIVRDLAVAEGDVRNVGDMICRLEDGAGGSRGPPTTAQPVTGEWSPTSFTSLRRRLWPASWKGISRASGKRSR